MYEIILNEQDEIILEYLSFLPSLTRLCVNYSKIIEANIQIDFLAQRDSLFTKMEYLDLSFNNITNENIHLIRHIRTLKTLILMGNSITAEIPDLSGLVNLEELNLSYNKIETLFINEGFHNPIIKEKKIIIQKQYLDNAGVIGGNNNMDSFIKYGTENVSVNHNMSKEILKVSNNNSKL